MKMTAIEALELAKLGCIQYTLPDGQLWRLFAAGPDANEYVLIRSDGGYEQWQDVYTDIDTAIASAEEIAPLDQWTDAEW